MDEEGEPEAPAPGAGDDEAEQPAPDPGEEEASPRPGSVAEAERAIAKVDWIGRSLSAQVARSFADPARMAKLLEPTFRMAEQMQRQFAMNQAAMQSIFDASKMLDGIVPKLVKPMELAVASQAARLVAGPSALLTARLALDAQFRVAESLRGLQLPAIQSAALIGASRAIASMSESLLAQTRFVPDVERSLATMLAGWKAAAVQPRVDLIDRGWLTSAGLTTWESTRAGAMILGSPEVEVEEPAWEEAPGNVRERLRARLADLDSGLVRKLDGARERLATRGLDAAGQAATSLVELIDWALRIAAPEEKVLLGWHADNGRPATELHDGKPTRRLKVVYLLVTAGRDPKSGEYFTSGLLRSLTWLEGAKHELDFDDVGAVEAAAMAVEGYLAYVLL